MNVGLLLVAIVFVGMVFMVFYIYSTTSPTRVYYFNNTSSTGSNPASATTEARRKMALTKPLYTTANGVPIYSKVYTNPPR